jgi:hypothetical protein
MPEEVGFQDAQMGVPYFYYFFEACIGDTVRTTARKGYTAKMDVRVGSE